jgi:hypothetical protein
MAIFKRVPWRVFDPRNNKLIDVVYFPQSFDAKSIKRELILYYGYKGQFEVEPK